MREISHMNNYKGRIAYYLEKKTKQTAGINGQILRIFTSEVNCRHCGWDFKCI